MPGVLAVVACETVPYTNRSQLLLIPEGTEVQMGLSSYQDVLKKGNVSHDPALNDQVKRVGDMLAAQGDLDAALENLGPYCYEAVEVDLTVYHENGEQESKLLFVGPTPQAIHEAQRRCMLEDVAAILARQFDKPQVAEVTALVNDLFDRDWKDKAAQQKKPERAFENYTRPSRKNLH